MVNRCCNTTQHVTNIIQNYFESNLPVKVVEAKIRVFCSFFLHIVGISRSHGS